MTCSSRTAGGSRLGAGQGASPQAGGGGVWPSGPGGPGVRGEHLPPHPHPVLPRPSSRVFAGELGPVPPAATSWESERANEMRDRQCPHSSTSSWVVADSPGSC